MPPIFIVAIVATLASSMRISNKAALPASVLVQQGLDALGGAKMIESVLGVTYHVPDLYRTQTLMEAYSLTGVDHFCAIAGEQNISFSYTLPSLQQRIDRKHKLDLREGADGFSCFLKGNNYLYLPPDSVLGYADGLATAFYIREAQMMSPFLLSKIQSSKELSSFYVTLGDGIERPAVHDSILNLTIIMDPDTYLPQIIRSYEYHDIFGPSTNDLYVRFKTFYNVDHILMDFLVDSITVNPEFPDGFFDGTPENQTQTTKESPIQSPDYGFAEIGEYISNFIWGGKYTGTLAKLSATHPIPNLPNLWHLTFQDAPNYSQLVVVFEHAVIVMDAAPHQSLLVIEWVRETLERNITHVWVTHHHHDHSYGVKDYVNVGAKLIVLESAISHWSRVPRIEMLPYSSNKPFVYRDSSTEVRFLHVGGAMHAEDMSYAYVSAACPEVNDSAVIFEADYWNPGSSGYEFNQNQALELLQQVKKDGVARGATVVPAHGVPAPLSELIDITGFLYPNFTVRDFTTGGPSRC
ncbi:metallo-beta-lactamase superfamily protein [Xylogone sp. PMI_703]|nr:metallo-beta-lactamase superfamily protein [Xylogone sp. PMI_703]